MTEKQDPIIAILVKYALKQELSVEEQQLLDEWRSRSDSHAGLPDQLRDPEWREDHQREVEEAPSAAMWANIRQHIRETKVMEGEPVREQRRVGRRWVAAAAVVIVLLGAGWWYVAGRRPMEGQALNKAPFLAALNPGDNVELLLGNGHIVYPRQARPGDLLAEEGGMRIFRTDNGIQYAPITGVSSSETTHSINIGRRVTRSFQIGFPDGSQVWLDTSTRFAYPLRLRQGPEPVVEGQAFFRIAHHDPAHPLRIWTGKGENVQVLGTSFTVRSYAAEAQGQVELYTGKVRVQRKRDSLLLRPDLMAVMTEDRGLQLQKMGRHEDLPGWTRPPAKSPYFEFQDTPLADALGEVAGWYGQIVSNPNRVPGVPVTGKLPHSETLEHTVQALQQVQGWHAVLKCKNDTIFVLPPSPGH